ncbi:MAG: tRNA 2-thiouridine(34) synthase MnmA [Gemmatimonadota bacterium]
MTGSRDAAGSAPVRSDPSPVRSVQSPVRADGEDASNQRILVAMSGGVDSSVTAALLVETGHEVVGVTMKTFCYSENEGPSRSCCGLEGISDARRVADTLGIPHYVFDVEDAFTRDVVDDFVSEYARGRTPNPCVRCNSTTKFPDLLQRGRAFGCDGIATGHYVRSEHRADGTTALYRGLDEDKDQAYFLWGLPREILPRLHFPLGTLTKPEVRERARELGLVTADKPESQEICFVPTGDYRDFLEKELPRTSPALEPGSLVTRDGTEVGEHDGYAGYTVGQRRGFGGGFPQAMYVLEIRPDTREVVIGPREALYAGRVVISEMNWLTEPLPAGDEVEVQIRYGARPTPARVLEAADPVLVLEFETPQMAVTPGQSGVLFRGDRLLGGGRIESALPADRGRAREATSAV